MRSCLISYQREDKAIADRVYLRLRQHGRDVWMDKPPAPFRDSGIPPGADWDDMILDRLRHAMLSCRFSRLGPFRKKAISRRNWRWPFKRTRLEQLRMWFCQS